MFYLLLFFCALFSTTFGHQDGLTELKNSTKNGISISKKTTLIKLGHELQNSHALLDFWIKENEFEFYIDAKDCIDETASTSFIIGGGNRISLKFDFAETTSFNESKVNATVAGKYVENVNLYLENGKIKVMVYLKEKRIFLNNTNGIKLQNIMFSLGTIDTFPFHHSHHGVEPRVSFFAFNDGHCNIKYEMPHNTMIPLTASPPTHHHDATTPYFVNATEKLPEELTKKWTTFETICYAYMWVLSCALAFVIGICAGQAKPKTRQVRTIEVASTSV